MLNRNIPAAALILAVFGTVGAGLVALTHAATKERIANNEREQLLRQINELVPGTSIDNDMLNDQIEIQAPDALGAPSTLVYRGRRAGEPVAAVLSPVLARGYNGPIKLIVAVLSDGTLGGIRVLAHRETPGLGDKIEVDRSDWILGFAGRSLSDPVPEYWRVKRDGGEFDQFTGATITPRGIVTATRLALDYSAHNWDRMFTGGSKAAEQ